jgi:hypothetical protein
LTSTLPLYGGAPTVSRFWFTRARSSSSFFSCQFAWRRLSVQTLQIVISVSAPVCSP